MADRKISDLTALTQQASGDLLPIVDVSAAAAADKNKSITVEELFQGIPVSVGIGTAAPSSSLHISDSATIQARLISSGASTAILFSDDATTDSVRIGTVGDELRFRTDQGAYTFRTNNSASEAVRIDSSGRLLVGTTTSREFGAGTSGGTAESQLQIEGEGLGESSISLARNADSSGSSRFFFGKSRGTTNGSNTIVQNDDTLGEIIFEGADGSKLVQAAWITAEVDGTPGADDMPGRLVFSTTADGASIPTERMRITESGRIYTYSSTVGLTVAVSAAASTTNAEAIFTGTNSATGVATGTIAIRILSNGNVINVNNSYGAISDIKLKENIVDANSQWDDIKGLRVVNYNLKPETGAETNKQLGLIAQEVEKVCPGLVGETPDRDDDGNDLGTVTKNVNYSVLYMKAVGALQEAMTRIEQLEAKVTALESK